MTNKDKYELTFWKQECMKDDYYFDAYSKMLAIWGVDGFLGDVLEIGAGPFSGFLPLIQASKKVSIDPNNDVYFKSLYKKKDDIQYINNYFENVWIRDESFDTVFCKNTLDHGDMGFKEIDKIKRILKKGGRFYLHVNIRREDQLNDGHDHLMNLGDFAVQTDDMRKIMVEVYRNCPIHPQDGYETLIAVLEK